MLHPIRTVDELQQACREGYQPKFLFFWGHQPRPGGTLNKECLSQWWPAAFTIDQIEFPTAEHFMMAEKARLFDDRYTFEKILQAPHPGAAKKLGRQVQGFDEATWVAARFDIVVRGNAAKFSQNEALGTFLVGTKNRLLVEASPVDRIWGIGLSADDKGAEYPDQWKGLNLLGFALMEVRARIQERISSVL